jgi:hypothetical protein
MAQYLDLEGKLDHPVPKVPILGFQSLKQIPIVMPFSTPGTRPQAGLAGPCKVENGSGFPAVR